MSAKRVRELARAMLLGFARDRGAFFFTLVFPLLFLFIFGGIFGDEGASGKIRVYVTGTGAIVERLPAQVLELERVDSLDEGVAKVADGDRVAVIAQQGEQVTVRYQASDQVAGQTVLGIVGSVVADTNLDALGGREAFRLSARQVEDESLGAIEFYTPGLLGWAVSIGAVFGAAITLVTWRDKGVLRRLRLAPVAAGEIALARLAVSVGIALVQAGVFVTVGVLLFDLDLSGPWWMAFPLVSAGTLAFLGIGLLAGAVSRSVEAASAIANLITVPMAFLSGSFFPLDLTPGWLQTLAQALPLTHLLEALKDVMVRGRDATSVLPELGILLGFALAFAVVATRLFRWDRP